MKSSDQEVQPSAWSDLPKTMTAARRSLLLVTRLSAGVRYLSDPRTPREPPGSVPTRVSSRPQQQLFSRLADAALAKTSVVTAANGNTETVSCSVGVINCLVRQQFIYTRLLLMICGPCCHKSRSLALQMSAALSFAGHFRSDWKSVQNGDGVGG